MKQQNSRNVCFHCGGNTCWNCDFTFEECGIIMEDDDGNALDGIVHYLTCQDCGAEIEYHVPIINSEVE